MSNHARFEAIFHAEEVLVFQAIADGAETGAIRTLDADVGSLAGAVARLVFAEHHDPAAVTADVSVVDHGLGTLLHDATLATGWPCLAAWEVALIAHDYAAIVGQPLEVV